MFYIGLTISALLYEILFVILYFSKKRINLIENKLLIFIMSINIIGLILELGCYLVLYFMKIQDTTIGMIILKSYVAYIIIFNWFLTGYIFVITNKNYGNLKYDMKTYLKKVLLAFSPVVLIMFGIIYYTPLYYYNVYPRYYTYGISVDFIALSFIFLAPIWIYRCFSIMIKNKATKKVNNQISLILFGILLMGASGAIIQIVDKSIIILTSAHAFALSLIYFTIENPDVKMIRELRHNKTITEQANEDKANFLFRASQEVKQPIDDIFKASKVINDIDDIETIKKGCKYINYNSRQLKTIINDILDVSKIDAHNIKITDSTYNVYTIFMELFNRYENMKNDKIEFRHNISKNLPQTLYGDPVKLKQVINTVLQNAFDYTKEGFIDVNVDSITKNDVCRLIISVEDSGIGMSIDKINELLTISEDLSDDDISKLENINVNLNIATKIIKLLGGQIIIKSEEGKGSEFIIVLEQKIKKDENKKDDDDYKNLVMRNKRVLLVDNKQRDMDVITNYLRQYDIEVSKSMYGNDCIDKILNHQKFDLILLEDDMKPESAINILQRLKLIDKFKIPVVVMLEKDKETIKQHYIEDGFTDYLLKEDLEQELDRIIKQIL